MPKPALTHETVNPWIVAVAVMFATFMEILDTTVVNVSLPHIAGSLSASIDESTWVLTSYLVANAVILPLTGWLARYFGRKRILIASISGFTVASFLCGLAPTLPMLVLFRVIQGATGGALQPLSQAVLLEAFPPQDRGKAMGFWGLGIVVAPILGPVVGGWLTDAYSWRWVFLINIPIGVVSVLMTRAYVHDPPYLTRKSETIDTWGIGLLAVGIGSLQVLLDKGQEEDWFASDAMRLLAAAAVLGLGAFIVRELVVEHPVVELRALKDRTYATGVFLMTVLGFVLYGSLVVVPILLQTLLGYPSLQAGIAMSPRGVGSFLAMPVIGVILARVGARKLIAMGLVAGALTLFALGHLNLDIGYWDIAWPQFFQGISLGLLFVPLTTATMDPIPKEEMGNATSIFNVMRNIGGSFGIAASTTFIARKQQVMTNLLGGRIDLYDPRVRAFLDGLKATFQARGADAATAARQAEAALFGLVQRQAAMVSFVQVFRTLGLVFLVMTPLVLLMRSPRKGGGPAMAH